MTKLEWSDDGEGGLVATHYHFEDAIEVKIVDYGCGADRIELSCGSLDMAIDAPGGQSRRFAEWMIAPFITLINGVNVAAREAERDSLPRTLCTPAVGFDGNGSPV